MLLSLLTSIMPLLVPLSVNTSLITVDHSSVVLQALDKVTARVIQLEVPAGSQAEFGDLAISVHACRTTPPEEEQESAAFLVIVDRQPGEEPKTVFSGWMFSASPALSAMDHPVYDIWVLQCGR